ncbi:T-complex protein 11-domain-containing protein [Absidia repens]|uniref:T-complex protein 11-domain-containing protein n=1 Tax=Absidia repens TaxID=90262 RepID=A0A1X2I766_9FUNG|nr:T-complex protein 11-domain-containing protein [Absidia repens]
MTTSSSIPLTSIKHALSIVDDWFDTHHASVTSLERIALEEVWNSYYAVAEICKTEASSGLAITNLSTLFLEIVRLQQLLNDLDQQQELQQLEFVKNSVTGLLALLKQHIERLETPDRVIQLEEAAERIIAGHAAHQMTNHSIPSSPTPRPQKLSQPGDTAISAEHLNRLLSGYASSVGGLSNEQLAHELIMNPGFQLQKSKPSTDLEQRIDTIARKAFFDQINSDIQQGTHLKKSLLPLLEDIRSRLLSFVPPTSNFYRLINDALDLTLFEQQMTQQQQREKTDSDSGGDVFDLKTVIRFIVDMMVQMAAPIRDEAIRQINEVTMDQGYQLRLILETLEMMTLDLMNFRLKALRPHLVPVAVDYEHDAFAKAIGLGTVGLAKTRQWLQQALQRLTNKRIEQGEKATSTESQFSTTTVLDEGYIGLFTATSAWDRLTCPETVLLDVERIIAYQNDLQEVVIVAALALLGKNAGIKQVKSFTKKIFLLLKNTREGDDGTTNLEHLSAEMERAISADNGDAIMDENKKQWIKSIVGKTLSYSDPVYGLLGKRCASIIRQHLATGHFVDDTVLLQSGLEPVQPQLRALCIRINLFAEHNRRVYGSWYHEIVTDLQHHDYAR